METPSLPKEVAQKVQEFVEGIDFDLHKDNLDSLGAHVWEEMRLHLAGDEEAHVAVATEATDLADRLAHVLSLAWHRQQRAERAFHLLDEAGKGVVVVEDLRRVVADILHEEELSDQDLHEMVDEMDQSGDGLLTKDDFYRLAVKVNL